MGSSIWTAMLVAFTVALAFLVLGVLLFYLVYYLVNFFVVGYLMSRLWSWSCLRLHLFVVMVSAAFCGSFLNGVLVGFECVADFSDSVFLYGFGCMLNCTGLHKN